MNRAGLIEQIEILCRQYGAAAEIEKTGTNEMTVAVHLAVKRSTGLLVRRAQRFIAENYNQNITLKTVSEYLYISPNYFSELFKKETGERFVDYLNGVRIQKAKELLMTQGMKCYEAASFVGYDNPAYFIKVFKRFTGVTPKQYQSVYSVCEREGLI